MNFKDAQCYGEDVTMAAWDPKNLLCCGNSCSFVEHFRRDPPSRSNVLMRKFHDFLKRMAKEWPETLFLPQLKRGNPMVFASAHLGTSRFTSTAEVLPPKRPGPASTSGRMGENLQENPIFHGKIYGFQFRFSLKPIRCNYRTGPKL